MRMALGAAFLLASACWARAGVHVVLDDGTKMTVESYWTDGEQVHLVTGGVDMIVTKARIKLLDEFAADPEPYENFGSGEARIDGVAPSAIVQEPAAPSAEPVAGDGSEADQAAGDSAASDPDVDDDVAVGDDAIDADDAVAAGDAPADDEAQPTVAGVNVGAAAVEPTADEEPAVDDEAAAVAAAERANPTASFWIPPAHRGDAGKANQQP
jgi:hypothetical protein